MTQPPNLRTLLLSARRRILIDDSLQRSIDSNGGFGLDFNGDPDLHTWPDSELLYNFVHQIGELLLGSDWIEIDLAVKQLPPKNQRRPASDVGGIDFPIHV